MRRFQRESGSAAPAAAAVSPLATSAVALKNTEGIHLKDIAYT